MGKQSEQAQQGDGMQSKRIPLLLYPFVVIWRFFARMVALLGRVTAAITGLMIMTLGVALTATVLGAIFGIPLVIFGFLLVVRALF